MSDTDAPFTAEDVIGVQPKPNSTICDFAIRLPDGEVGRAVARNLTAHITAEDVAAAINFHVEGYGLDAVVDDLKSAEGLGIDPSFSASRRG